MSYVNHVVRNLIDDRNENVAFLKKMKNNLSEGLKALLSSRKIDRDTYDKIRIERMLPVRMIYWFESYCHAVENGRWKDSDNCMRQYKKTISDLKKLMKYYGHKD